MQILVLSWEYPPKSVGGLAQHVYHLCNALANIGEEVHIITVGGPETPLFEKVNQVNVHRVHPYQLSAPDFRTWILQLNISMLEYAINLVNKMGNIDLVHAHDWLVAYAGRAIKHAYKIPMVTTIHATESGRNHGLHNEEQRYISDVEWWLTYEAWRVIVCSQYMRQELKGIFQLPEDKLKVIPNGVNPDDFKTSAGIEELKKKNAPKGERVIFFIGRLVQEKGVHVLLDAVPKIVAHSGPVKVLIAGEGPRKDFLMYKARAMGIENLVDFVGYVNDEARNKLFKMADVAVFPSLYEPFGIVALEAMAAGTPVVVSDSGGLGEIVQHGVNGLKAYVGSADSLADNILNIFNQKGLAEKLQKRAFTEVRDIYSWSAIAHETSGVYREVISQYHQSTWEEAGIRPESVYDRIKNMGRYANIGVQK